MVALGLSSKREITRTRVRVRTAMAAQTREQGRYLGGRPPYGYRLADAGPHPNKAHAASGRRAHRLEPDPVTSPVVTWMFGQRLAGHSAARITRALNDAGCCARRPRTRDGTRTGPVRGGRCGRWRRSWLIPGTRGVKCGTGSRRRRSWSIRLIPGLGTGRCSGGTCPRDGSSRNIPRTGRWSARPTSSPPRTPRRRAARPARRCDGTCWPGLSRAGGADAGSNRADPTAGPRTGAATATPAPPSPIPAGRRTLMSARTRSCRTWPPSPSCWPAPPGSPPEGAASGCS